VPERVGSIKSLIRSIDSRARAGGERSGPRTSKKTEAISWYPWK
jgi:hypothetical protein